MYTNFNGLQYIQLLVTLTYRILSYLPIYLCYETM